MLTPCRIGSVAIALLFLATAPLPLPAQARRPVVTLTGGLGNVLGGLGVGAEYYFAGGRASAAAGLGYWPEESLCNRGTFSGAGAMRGFLGSRHRAFLEASFSLLQISCGFDGEDIERHYGPGISLGYRYIGSDGFTFTGAIGVGDVPDSGREAIILLGLGYTWQR